MASDYQKEYRKRPGAKERIREASRRWKQRNPDWRKGVTKKMLKNGGAELVKFLHRLARGPFVMISGVTE